MRCFTTSYDSHHFSSRREAPYALQRGLDCGLRRIQEGTVRALRLPRTVHAGPPCYRYAASLDDASDSVRTCGPSQLSRPARHPTVLAPSRPGLMPKGSVSLPSCPSPPPSFHSSVAAAGLYHPPCPPAGSLAISSSLSAGTRAVLRVNASIKRASLRASVVRTEGPQLHLAFAWVAVGWSSR